MFFVVLLYLCIYVFCFVILSLYLCFLFCCFYSFINVVFFLNSVSNVVFVFVKQTCLFCIQSSQLIEMALLLAV